MLAIGWWRASNGVDARLEIYDLIFGFALASHDLPAPNGATQNLVTAARLTGDGRRAAFATWGNGSSLTRLRSTAWRTRVTVGPPASAGLRGLSPGPWPGKRPGVERSRVDRPGP